MCIYLFIVDILKSNSDQNIVFSFCMNDSLPGCDIMPYVDPIKWPDGPLYKNTDCAIYHN